MTECPNCRMRIEPGAKECPGCGLIFEKFLQKRERESAGAPARSAGKPPPALTGSLSAEAGPGLRKDVGIALILAAVTALCFAWNFRGWLPMPEGWGKLTRLWFPVTMADLAFHEAGHIIFGLFRWQFLMIMGGTLMQLLIPSACLLQFVKRRSLGGIGATVWWIGENLVGIAYYAADARTRALILIGGKSGMESSLYHDWNIMLQAVGLRDFCVGIGQILFFLGCLAMSFPLYWAAARGWRRAFSSGPPRGSG